MKINEIEEMMTIKGFSEDLFSEYVLSLKRVKSGALKSQLRHCDFYIQKNGQTNLIVVEKC